MLIWLFMSDGIYSVSFLMDIEPLTSIIGQFIEEEIMPISRSLFIAEH